jgi:GNAT superfamily N-acetyltransferase
MSDTQLLPPVLMRPAGPDDAGLLAELLAGLSPASSFHRFQAGLGAPKPALVRGLLRTEPRRGALLAVARGGAGEHALGHACWSVTSDRVVDVGVLVADAVQGRGIGTSLFLGAVDAAKAAGAETVHLDVHPENRRLVATLRRRFGGGAFVWEHGLLTLDVPVAAPALTSSVVMAA